MHAMLTNNFASLYPFLTSLLKNIFCLKKVQNVRTCFNLSHPDKNESIFFWGSDSELVYVRSSYLGSYTFVPAAHLSTSDSGSIAEVKPGYTSTYG